MTITEGMLRTIRQHGPMTLDALISRTWKRTLSGTSDSIRV